MDSETQTGVDNVKKIKKFVYDKDYWETHLTWTKQNL